MKEVVDQHSSGPVDARFADRKLSSTGGLADGDRSDGQGDLGAVGPAAASRSVEPLTATDPLAELGPVLATVARRDRDSAEAATVRAELGRKFLDDFAEACAQEIRPAMGAVLIRLQQLGGDGLIEEHPGGEARFEKPRITLWMSLKDKIVGEPRPDRHPYLLLEADVEAQKVQVDEGDMWRGAGGNFSGRVGVWGVTELTHDRVTKELLSIAHRAAGEHPSG
jgi:hypothetical protein